MEIVKANAAVLTNLEVLQELKKHRSGRRSHGLRNLATITYETLQFLESSPAMHQKAEKILEFYRAMKEYNLTKEEVLMMVNDPPTAAIHINVVVQYTEDRLTEEQIAEILQLAKLHLLPAEEEQPEDGAG